jgi:hypothetical protein
MTSIAAVTMATATVLASNPTASRFMRLTVLRSASSEAQT